MGVTETIGMVVYFLITGGIAMAMGVRHKPHRLNARELWEAEDSALLGRRDRAGDPRSAVTAFALLDSIDFPGERPAPTYFVRSVARRRKGGRGARLETGSRRRLSLLEEMAEIATCTDGVPPRTQFRPNGSNVSGALRVRAFSSSRR